MNIKIISAVLAVLAPQAFAEELYRAEYVQELRSLGLNEAAFYYAIQWAGQGDHEAEYEVAISLIEGTGVDANPTAAMIYACGPRSMDDIQIAKILIKGNMRLVDKHVPQYRCEE